MSTVFFLVFSILAAALVSPLALSAQENIEEARAFQTVIDICSDLTDAPRRWRTEVADIGWRKPPEKLYPTFFEKVAYNEVILGYRDANGNVPPDGYIDLRASLFKSDFEISEKAGLESAFFLHPLYPHLLVLISREFADLDRKTPVPGLRCNVFYYGTKDNPELNLSVFDELEDVSSIAFTFPEPLFKVEISYLRNTPSELVAITTGRVTPLFPAKVKTAFKLDHTISSWKLEGAKSPKEDPN
ncbi:MAG: hypothetical protein GY947_16505 [Rhodobacteraceae bacterium]|nr:hypothetical protein [Paracoccaceae bacterium]